MTEKYGIRTIGTTTFLILICSISAFAVSFPAQLYHSKERHDKFIKGETLYLFHSGTNEVLNTIHLNDNLAVYRITESCEVAPVGVVRVLSFIGGNHIKAEVFAGEIKPDDIAKKNNISCLVISAGICRK